jgi:hypothetical protein
MTLQLLMAFSCVPCTPLPPNSSWWFFLVCLAPPFDLAAPDGALFCAPYTLLWPSSSRQFSLARLAPLFNPTKSQGLMQEERNKKEEKAKNVGCET